MCKGQFLVLPKPSKKILWAGDVTQFAEWLLSMPEAQSLTPSTEETRVVIHTYNPSTTKAQAGESEVQGPPWQYSE